MHPKEKIVENILKQFRPDRDALLKLISSRITDVGLMDLKQLAIAKPFLLLSLLETLSFPQALSLPRRQESIFSYPLSSCGLRR